MDAVSKGEDQMGIGTAGVLDVSTYRRQGASGIYPVAILLC